ncbi:hypothetical protein AB3K78_11760 [Leucobacter sp. HNU]|uniref:hypothetical protein n=1 Tax=Leucobacter sp. HNU TaxID=3236805 RepID=UPI003A7F92CA
MQEHDRLRRAPDTAPLIEEIEERRQARQSIQLNIAKRLTTNAEAAPALELLTAEIEERQRRLDALTTETPLSDFAAKGAVKPKWQAMDLIAKRRTIAELMDRIVINRGKPGPPPKGPDGQRIVDLDRVAIEWAE